MGVKTQGMDVYFDQFLSARLGSLADKKNILNFYQKYL
jgi:hypothetical protein